jgi:hypothetical protein
LRCPNPGPRRVVPGPAFPPLWRRQHVGFHLHGAEAGSAIQTWKIFLRNHVVASIDLFVVPTIAYQQLFVLLEGGLPCLGFFAKATPHRRAQKTSAATGAGAPIAKLCGANSDVHPARMYRRLFEARRSPINFRVAAAASQCDPLHSTSQWQCTSILS